MRTVTCSRDDSRVLRVAAMLTVEVIIIDEKLAIEVVDGNVFVVNVLIGVLFAMIIVFDDVYKEGFFLFCNS